MSVASFNDNPTSNPGYWGVQANAGRSSGKICLPLPMTTALSRAFFISLTLPGQSYSTMRFMAALDIIKLDVPLSFLKMSKKYSASNTMSSLRSLKGGI